MKRHASGNRQAEAMTANSRKQRHEAGILQQRLRRTTGRAIGDYNMIDAGDKVMVCVSGGKDSLVLLDMLLQLQQRAPVTFSIMAVTLDQGHPGFPADVLRQHYQQLGVEFLVELQDTYSIVKRLIPEGKTMCSLCSRLRRGVLYQVAADVGASRIALGHHCDDIMETFFLNLFYGGKLKAMPPRLQSDDGRHTVIRPLAYCREADIARYAENKKLPVIPCELCGSQEGLQRQAIKAMLKEWERARPGRVQSIFRALGDIVPSHLLDRELHDFTRMAEQFTDSGRIRKTG